MSYPELRDTLHAEAESALAGVDAAGLVRTGLAAHRHRRRVARTVAAAATVAVTAGAIPLIRAVTHTAETAEPPAKTYRSPFEWPTRGALAGDQALTASLLKATVPNPARVPHSVAYLGPGPGDRTWGIVLDAPAPSPTTMSICYLDKPGPDYTGPNKQPTWHCLGTDGPRPTVLAATGGIELAPSASSWIQVALLPPGWHVAGASDPYFATSDDNGIPTGGDGSDIRARTERADGVMIESAPLQGTTGPGGTVAAMQVSGQPPNGTARTFGTATARQDLVDRQIFWGWGPKQQLRGLPPLLDNPEQNPGLRLWARLYRLNSEMPAYFSPLWGGTLADGSRAIIIEPASAIRTNTVFMVNPPAKGDADTFLVRDLENPALPSTVHQISAYLPLSDGRCELVVVAAPGTTRITYRDTTTSSFTDLPQPKADGVGRLVLPTCREHENSRIQVFAGANRTYEGPIDSTKPGGGPKH